MSAHKSAATAPFAGTVQGACKFNESMVTGSWRMSRVVLDKEKCTQCLTCWGFCPDACITPTEDFVEHNHYYCKGCGICIRVCPVGALTGVPELDFADDV